MEAEEAIRSDPSPQARCQFAVCKVDLAEMLLNEDGVKRRKAWQELDEAQKILESVYRQTGSTPAQV